MGRTKIALTFVILAACMWGTVGVTVKVLSGFGLTAIQMVVGRLAVAAVLMGVFLLITDKSKFKIIFAIGILNTSQKAPKKGYENER
ncbi:MAG TPA: hypothetical protein VN381_02065 [Anaerovoracaceae bacterium]|nr:hypothetical protein [Anaerovoracaceae bacterium]